MISVVSPIYNEEDNIEELCRRIIAAVEPCGEEFEIILVENGSRDKSGEIIAELHQRDPRIKYIVLSRNFGHQGGIFAGLANASGHAVISLDGDLQHPPEIIPKMIELWRQGYDVVYTIKEGKADHEGWHHIPRTLFYKLMNRISEVKLSHGQSDFRLMDRAVVNVLMNIPEKNIFLRGLVDWVGFRQTGLHYKPDRRHAGESKFNLKRYMSFALDGILSFSVIPLKMLLHTGLVVSGLCVLYGLFILSVYILNMLGITSFALPPGWTTIILAVVFIGAVQLIGIGILGEYIGRIFTQVKGRPGYIVKESGLEPVRSRPSDRQPVP